MTQFTEIVKKTFEQTFSDIVSDRLMSAINQTKQAAPEAASDNGVEPDDDDNRIVTTEEELNGYYIVKSIVRSTIPAERVYYRDSVYYCSIILDNNCRKCICRLWLNSQKKKYIGFLDSENKETKHEITTLDDIYNYSNELIERINFLDQK